MSWSLAVPLIMSGLSIAQGYMGSEASQRNADASRAWGAYNAAQARRFSEFNADAIEKLASINSALIDASTETNVKITEALSQYNATLRVQAAEYNAKLLEKEAELVWQSQELDQEIFARQASILQKETRARFASSGVDVNSGSPVDYMVDQSTQIHLESFIIRHNAEIQMGKLLDAAALGRWQGEAEASAIMFQGAMESLTLETQANIQMSQLNSQAAYDAIMTRYSGELRASQILNDATWQASQYEQEGTMSLITGLFQGASWAAKAYELNALTNLGSTPTSTASTPSSTTLTGTSGGNWTIIR